MKELIHTLDSKKIAAFTDMLVATLEKVPNEDKREVLCAIGRFAAMFIVAAFPCHIEDAQDNLDDFMDEYFQNHFKQEKPSFVASKEPVTAYLCAAGDLFVLQGSKFILTPYDQDQSLEMLLSQPFISEDFGSLKECVEHFSDYLTGFMRQIYKLQKSL